MVRSCFLRRRVWAVLTAAAALASAAPARGQTASESALKAAFIFNFAKFTEWPAPALPPGSSLALCVLNDGAVKDALKQLVKGQTIAGHEVFVVDDDTPATACHILYIPGQARKRNTPLMTALKNSPVLTVSDGPADAGERAIAELFLEAGKMRFAINVDTAQRSQIRISSRLLSLAKIVRNDHAE